MLSVRYGSLQPLAAGKVEHGEPVAPRIWFTHEGADVVGGMLSVAHASASAPRASHDVEVQDFVAYLYRR